MEGQSHFGRLRAAGRHHGPVSTKPESKVRRKDNIPVRYLASFSHLKDDKEKKRLVWSGGAPCAVYAQCGKLVYQYRWSFTIELANRRVDLTCELCHEKGILQYIQEVIEWPVCTMALAVFLHLSQHTTKRILEFLSFPLTAR